MTFLSSASGTVRRLRRRLRPAVFVAVASLSVSLGAPTARAMCWCVVPPGQSLQWTGQVTLVVREGGTVRMVPNIRVSGSADDFALIVPTPALPALAPVDKAIWAEATDMTKPISRRPLNGMDCGTATNFDAGVTDGGDRGGVTVHSTETVGSFIATIVSSTDPSAFETWLTDNGYQPDSAQVAAFTPLVNDGWYFTCMKLVPGTPVPAGGWNNSVDPVELTFASDDFVLPLDALAINASSLPGVGLYAVDDHRMTIEGFSTDYANRINAAEMREISRRYPTLAPYLAEGRTLTYLSQFFWRGPPSGTVALEQAATDDEVRTGRNARTVPGELVMLLGLILGLAWRSARGRRRAAVSAAA